MSSGRDPMWDRSRAVEAVLDLRNEILADRPPEEIALSDIGGHTLATDVIADEDLPAHDHATMDGYAFDATDDYPLSVIDREVFPEDEPPDIAPGEAVRIATGAPLPPSANAVLKREEATLDEESLTGSPLEPGSYTYARGSNVTEGDHLFAAGERLHAKDALLLGDLGTDSVAIHPPFSVGMLATGTEIHEGRSRDLDTPMLMNLVREWEHAPTNEGSVPDTYERVRNRIAELAERHDVVLTTGGTSVGQKDYVIRALDELGDVIFHRVRLRPGKPIAMARLPEEDATVFAVPGKPVGAYTVVTLVARPFFTGVTQLPTVERPITHDVQLPVSGFEYAIPVTLTDGQAVPLGHTESPLTVYEDTFNPSVLSSSTRASRADGFVLTDSPVHAREIISVVPYGAVE